MRKVADSRIKLLRMDITKATDYFRFRAWNIVRQVKRMEVDCVKVIAIVRTFIVRESTILYIVSNKTDFVNENILDDMSCAKKIQALHGFKVWQKYETSCKGAHLQSWIDDVNKCLNNPLLRSDFENSIYPDPDRSAAQSLNLHNFIILLIPIVTLMRRLMLH